MIYAIIVLYVLTGIGLTTLYAFFRAERDDLRESFNGFNKTHMWGHERFEERFEERFKQVGCSHDNAKIKKNVSCGSPFLTAVLSGAPTSQRDFITETTYSKTCPDCEKYLGSFTKEEYYREQEVDAKAKLKEAKAHLPKGKNNDHN